MAPGIVEYYEQRNGNPAGIPIVHIGINLQAGQDAQTDNFIRQAGFKIVANDFDRAVASRFQSSGQPIFVVLNGVANSPSHKQWELLVNQNGYGTTQHPIETFRDAINQVRAPVALPPPQLPSAPSITVQPQSQTVIADTTVTFTAGATGTMPFAYQWRKNGDPIAGATKPIFALENVTVSQSGEYSVQISNAATSMLSEIATLTVLAPAAARASLNEFRRLADGAVEFTLRGEAGRSYRIEVSSNLVDWTVLGSVTTTNVTQAMRDGTTANIPKRFYRAATP